MWVTQQRKTRQTTGHINKWWGFSLHVKNHFRTSIGNAFLVIFIYVGRSGKICLCGSARCGNCRSPPLSLAPRETQRPQAPGATRNSFPAVAPRPHNCQLGRRPNTDRTLRSGSSPARPSCWALVKASMSQRQKRCLDNVPRA